MSACARYAELKPKDVLVVAGEIWRNMDDEEKQVIIWQSQTQDDGRCRFLPP